MLEHATNQHEEALQTKKLAQARLSNKEDALANDWTWKQSTTLTGLVYFQRETPVKALGKSQQRFYRQTSDLPEAIQVASRGHARRSCIRDATGTSRLEVVWSKRSASLFSVLDMGSASWPMQGTLYDSSKGKLGGDYGWDPPHRRHRFHINSLSRAGLDDAVAEVHLVLEFKKAPFGRSGFCGVISGATKELFEEWNHNTPLFADKHYPRLSHAMHRGRPNVH